MGTHDVPLPTRSGIVQHRGANRCLGARASCPPIRHAWRAATDITSVRVDLKVAQQAIDAVATKSGVVTASTDEIYRSAL